MRFFDYGKDGYKCLGDDGTILFEEVGTHNYLFEYVAKDLTFLEELFESYINCRLNTKTLELCRDSSGDKYPGLIEETLKSLHPYYQFAFREFREFREYCIDRIGNFFNRLLSYHCYKIYDFNSEIAKSEEWYLKTLEGLLEPFLRIGDEYPIDFYNKYKKQIGYYSYTPNVPRDDIITVIRGVGKGEFDIISDLMATQNTIRNILYYVLDITAQNFNVLNPIQRLWLYGKETDKWPEQQNITRHFSFGKNIRSSDSADNDMDQKANRTEQEPLSSPNLNDLESHQLKNNRISRELTESFEPAIKEAEKIVTMQFYDEYKVNSLRDLAYFEIMSMIQNKTMIRTCKNCGKYFVVTNRNTAYCDRIDESGKRCSAVGPSREFQKKMKEDEALKIYTRAYKTHFARVKKGTMEKGAFTEWCKEAKQKLEQARAHQLDIMTFQEWLKK